MHTEGLGPTLGRHESECCQDDDGPTLWKALVCRQMMFLAALAQQSEQRGLLSTQSIT